MTEHTLPVEAAAHGQIFTPYAVDESGESAGFAALPTPPPESHVVGQEVALRALMAKLADLLDENHFADCEEIVRKAGVEPPLSMSEDTRELLMAIENAARMAEQGFLSMDGGQAAVEIRSLVPARFHSDPSPETREVGADE